MLQSVAHSDRLLVAACRALSQSRVRLSHVFPVFLNGGDTMGSNLDLERWYPALVDCMTRSMDAGRDRLTLPIIGDVIDRLLDLGENNQLSQVSS